MKIFFRKIWIISDVKNWLKNQILALFGHLESLMNQWQFRSKSEFRLALIDLFKKCLTFGDFSFLFMVGVINGVSKVGQNQAGVNWNLKIIENNTINRTNSLNLLQCLLFVCSVQTGPAEHFISWLGHRYLIMVRIICPQGWTMVKVASRRWLEWVLNVPLCCARPIKCNDYKLTTGQFGKIEHQGETQQNSVFWSNWGIGYQ